MKADQYGTWAEQERARNGWLSGSKNPDKKERACRNCHRFDEQKLNGETTRRCEITDTATQVGAVCRKWAASEMYAR